MTITLYKNPITDSLWDALIKNPDKEVLIDFNNRSLKGKEVLDSIEKIAVLLATQGIKKNDRVVFLAQPSIESILYFFALTRVGATIVLADPEMGQTNFIERITFSKARWILQDPVLKKVEKYSFIKPLLRFFKIWFPENLPISNNHRITIQGLQAIYAKNISQSVSEEVINKDEDLAIIFTSGTTGVPKGVVHSYASLYEGIKLIIAEIPIDTSDFLYASQLYFLLIALNIPAKVYVPKQREFKAKSFLKIVEEQKITSTFLLPYEGQKVYSYCSSKASRLPQSLRTVLFGSAPVTKGFLSRFKTISSEIVKVFGVYGATEMLIISTVLMQDKLAYIGEGDFLGTALPGVTVKISDENEMLIAGPQMYTRYLGDYDKAEFFFSGDLGKVNPDGSLVMIGRKKDMIIRKGYNLYPGIFESIISTIPGVQECAIIGQYDNDLEDEKVVLFVVKEMGYSITKSEIINKLRSGLYSIDKQALPDQIIFIDELPQSGRSKKIDKVKLREKINIII